MLIKFCSKNNSNVNFFKSYTFKLTLFIITICVKKIEDDYELEKEPFLEYKVFATKFQRGKNKSTNEKGLVQTYNEIEQSCVVSFILTIISIQSKFKHDFIPKLKQFYNNGTTSDNLYSVSVVYEYNGEPTLKEYIDMKKKEGGFKIDEAIEILRSILIGMLHFEKKRNYLGNLNETNILVNEKSEIRFFDFSFFDIRSRGLINNAYFGYFHDLFDNITDPRIKNISTEFENKMDIYSFGILMKSIHDNIYFGEIAEADGINAKYVMLKNECSRPNIIKRFSIEEALEDKLFKLILPELYNSTLSSDFYIEKNNYIIKKIENDIYYAECDKIIIVQYNGRSPQQASLDPVYPSYYKFLINEEKVDFYSISNEDQDKIKLIFDSLKAKILEINPAIKTIKIKSAEEENLAIQKKYIQDLKSERIKTLESKRSSASVVHTPQNQSNENISQPAANQTTSSDAKSGGISLGGWLMIGAGIIIIGSIVIFFIYRYFKNKKEKE